MKLRCGRPAVVALAAGLLLLGISTHSAHAGVRLLGSVGASGYAYNDAANENHFWLLPNVRVSAYQTGTPYSAHFSASYLGDSADDFSQSGEARFLKGYLQYGGLGQRVNARLGRFFLYDGVVLGVVDGIDAGYRINRQFGVKAYAGMMGPIDRKFDFQNPTKAFSFGGTVEFTPTNCLIAEKGRMALSFTHQTREEGVVRQLVGLSTYHRTSYGLTWFNTLHLRPSGTTLRKLISRVRYGEGDWRTMGEFGVFTPNLEDYSWFNGFELSTSVRFRAAVDRYLVEDRWAVGVEGAYLTAGGKGGYRGGPVVTTPFGQVGYRMSGGEQAISSGPWVSLRYSPMENVSVYAYGAQVNYQWDALDIESDNLTMVHAGLRYTPGFFDSITLSGEFQVYQTPQFTQDRRGLGGLTWRFDTGRAER